MPIGSVDGANWAEIVLAFATVAVAIGIIFAGLEVLEHRRSRHAEMASVISRRWDSPDMTEIRRKVRGYETRYDLCKALEEAIANNDPLYHEFFLELNFLEELGSLHRHGGISIGWIRSTMGSVVVDRWTLWEPSIDHLRQLPKIGHITYFENFEALKKRLSDKEKASRRFRRWLASIIQPG